MFMHASWEHIARNMLFLWIFGNNIEDALGRVRFLVWYLAAGLRGRAAQTAVTLAFGHRQAASIPNIGASGAIAGVLGAYFVLLPRARVLTLFFGFILSAIPAIWFLGIWIALQLWHGGLSLVAPERRRRGRVLRPHRRLRLRRGRRSSRATAPRPRSRPAVDASRSTSERALASLPAELRAAIENVEIVVEDEHPDDPDLFGLWERGDWAGAPRPDHDLPAAARRVVSRPGRARGGDPDHRPPRARPLLRDRRGPARRARIWLEAGNRPSRPAFGRGMRTLTRSSRRSTASPTAGRVMRALSEGYDATLQAEHQKLEEQIAQLWEEQRNARAMLRFGDRDVIIQRARHEERLSRAA